MGPHTRRRDRNRLRTARRAHPAADGRRLCARRSANLGLRSEVRSDRDGPRVHLAGCPFGDLPRRPVCDAQTVALRARPGTRLELRLVAGLPSGDATPAPRARACNRRMGGRAGHARRLRYRAARRAGGFGLDRETYEPHRPALRLVRFSRRDRDDARSRTRPASQKELRPLPTLRRRVPDRCPARRLHDRCDPLHQRSHAADRRDPARAASARRAMGMGLRSLSGRLSADGPQRGAGRCGVRARQPGSGCARPATAPADACRRIPADVRPDGDGLARARGLTAQRRGSARERSGPCRRCGVDRVAEHRSASHGARTRRLGARSDRLTPRLRRPARGTRGRNGSVGSGGDNMRARWLTAVLLVISIRTADAANIGSNELFQRMEKLNADVKTYTASLHVDVAMKSFPYLSPTLDGNVYYEQPDRTAVVFNTVPVLAEQFKKVYPNIEPPSKWLELYDVSVVGDTNGTTWFKLVPKNAARVDHVDVRADDKTATIVAMTWTYKDGGYVTLAQQFGTFAGHLLVNRQTGHIELPGYKADVSAAFSGYKLNVPIDERVFGS